MSILGYGANDAKKTAKTVIRSWQLPLPIQHVDTVPVDTSMINWPLLNPLNRYSVSNVWNGNLISPVQSRIYFQRTNMVDDVFGHAYAPYLLTAQNVRFYNTTVPYSKIAYNRGFTKEHEEHEINFLFTGNLNRQINLGVEMNYLTSPGHYMSQEAKLFNGSVFGSYNGNHYSLQAAVTWNTLSHFDNGGLRRDSDLISSLNPEDMPVRMKGMAGYAYISAILNHYYNFTTERVTHDTIEVINNFGEKERRDTAITEYVPIITIMHTFETDNSTRRYRENGNVNTDYWGQQPWRNPLQTRDSSNVLTIRNTVAVTIEEEFNRLLRFGAKAYVINECQRFLRPNLPLYGGYLPQQTTGGDYAAMLERPLNWIPDTLHAQQWTNNTFVGGAIYKRTGPYIRYGIVGDVCLVGYKLGQFDIHGHVASSFRLGKDTFNIIARAYIKNETPSPYLQQYLSNHYRWTNDFGKVYRYYVGGQIAYPTQWVKPRLDVGFENVQRHIYYDRNGLPQQYDGHIQVIAADLHLDLTTPWVNLENNVIWQHSTSEFMPLPDLVLYHNLYYHGWWARKAMQAQMGVDVRYHTRYYAPIYNPATGQFCIQDEKRVGNYPIMTVYANFYVKLLHLKFFAHYTHFNHLFMRNNMNNFIMSGYPYNPDVFRAGLSWHFYR